VCINIRRNKKREKRKERCRVYSPVDVERKRDEWTGAVFAKGIYVGASGAVIAP
jgi:hypothetical protein